MARLHVDYVGNNKHAQSGQGIFKKREKKGYQDKTDRSKKVFFSTLATVATPVRQ
ncbi:hypothetical protein GCD22_00942 [Acidithiobacillus thiooxidans ATCC 19377]|uniref:Uncharacterized protein n=1 Tax=Acidithiobacillus thiooxidans ATCC 19377 TaxID=637390 RepID=A0A5P9XN08_ACITH|nr:hypothetical protein GCD22_00942 [Acidithiobacillus thiooxidans ATCC 19377]